MLVTRSKRGIKLCFHVNHSHLTNLERFGAKVSVDSCALLLRGVIITTEMGLFAVSLVKCLFLAALFCSAILFTFEEILLGNCFDT